MIHPLLSRCGEEKLTNIGYNHRKAWVLDRLALVGVSHDNLDLGTESARWHGKWTGDSLRFTYTQQR